MLSKLFWLWDLFSEIEMQLQQILGHMRYQFIYIKYNCLHFYCMAYYCSCLFQLTGLPLEDPIQVVILETIRRLEFFSNSEDSSEL